MSKNTDTKGRALTQRVASSSNELALIRAAATGNLPAIRRLIKEKGVNPEILDKDYMAPAIIFASSNGHHLAVQELAKLGANVNCSAGDGATPIAVATQEDHILVLRMLVKYGADINIPMTYEETINCYCNESKDFVERVELTTNKETLLHVAARSNSVLSIRELVDLGLDIDSTTDHGETPFLFAVEEGNELSIKVFVNLGADITRGACSTVPETPLDVARRKNHRASIEILEPYQEAINSLKVIMNNPLSESEKIKQIQSVLDLSASKNLSTEALLNSSLDDHYNKIIHLAIKQKMPNLTEFLLFQGANLEAKNFEESALNALRKFSTDTKQPLYQLKGVVEQIVNPHATKESIKDNIDSKIPKVLLNIIEEYTSFKRSKDSNAVIIHSSSPNPSTTMAPTSFMSVQNQPKKHCVIS